MLHIRQETPTDHQAVFSVIEQAFASVEESDQSESYLVERLRTSEAFVPELSLVAESDGKILGHILFTKIQVKGKAGAKEALALAPVSVLPSHQGQGIGGKLIERGHEIAREMGFSASILLGHETYYPRFGYQQLDQYGIRLPFEVPPQNCMVFVLNESAFEGTEGEVVYDKAFFG